MKKVSQIEAPLLLPVPIESSPIASPKLVTPLATLNVGPIEVKAVGEDGTAAAIRATHRTPAQKRLVKQLGEGETFDVKTTETIVAITGVPITKAGLLGVYAGAFAERPARVSAAIEKGNLSFTITWCDNLGNAIATLRRKLHRHEDGSLELYGHTQWVDPEYRGRGIAAEAFDRERSLLQALSDHPKTRLTLWAGGMANPKNRADLQTVGTYVWANFGYDFADQHGPRSPLAINADKVRTAGDDLKKSDPALMREQLLAWLGVEAEANRALAAALPGLKRLALKLRHPWELVSFSVELGGERLPLGKSFLLSKLAPRWEGSFFVNAKRAKPQRLADAYVEKNRALALETRKVAEEARAAALASPDPEVLQKAIAAAGKDASAAWIPTLEAIAAKSPDDEALQKLVETAILQIKGEWKPPRPAPVYYSSSAARDPARFEVPAEFKALEEKSLKELFKIVLEGDKRLAGASLDILGHRYAKERPNLVKVAATKLYDRFPGDDDWWARRNAVAILAGIPSEGGLPALIQISAKEDDINTMIAIHKELSLAESPAAEGPAAALLERIDDLKAQIEKALAEL